MKYLGQVLVDPGGLFLHTGHALRVTGAQGMARAGLPEHTIALIARWGSAAVLTYIRKAPLAASHHVAAVALAGWERGAAATRDGNQSSSVFPSSMSARASQAEPVIGIGDKSYEENEKGSGNKS